jgi:hypothetical protein
MSKHEYIYRKQRTRSDVFLNPINENSCSAKKKCEIRNVLINSNSAVELNQASQSQFSICVYDFLKLATTVLVLRNVKRRTASSHIH